MPNKSSINPPWHWPFHTASHWFRPNVQSTSSTTSRKSKMHGPSQNELTSSLTLYALCGKDYLKRQTYAWFGFTGKFLIWTGPSARSLLWEQKCSPLQHLRNRTPKNVLKKERFFRAASAQHVHGAAVRGSWRCSRDVRQKTPSCDKSTVTEQWRWLSIVKQHFEAFKVIFSHSRFFSGPRMVLTFSRRN